MGMDTCQSMWMEHKLDALLVVGYQSNNFNVCHVATQRDRGRFVVYFSVSVSYEKHYVGD